ncbi:MAG: class I SAM-dependent methyltransferase [Rhizomicrobium sp.]
MPASSPVKRILAPLRRGARALARFVADPAYRGMLLLALRRPRNRFQPYSAARPDRYPTIFGAARARLGDGPALRLLSFGCATGEEVATLRRYFPRAFIKGIDINPQSIAVCRAALGGDPHLAFAVAGSTAQEADASYDAIFCMAVLRHGDLARSRPPRCDHLIRFADFERTVADFARCLKPGGLLALRHSNFRFKDTAAAASFETVLNVHRYTDTPQYDPANRRLPDMAHESALFGKRR